MSCIGDYELDLRGAPACLHCVHALRRVRQLKLCSAGHKIGQIENLGTTEVRLHEPAVVQRSCTAADTDWHVQNQFDSIDFTDNAIIILDGFPKLPRLKTLLLANNRVTRIGRSLEGK